VRPHIRHAAARTTRCGASLLSGERRGETTVGCPDVVPFIGTALVSAARFNCELIVEGVTASNLQTFLGIRGPQIPAGERLGTRIESMAWPTTDQVRSIMRATQERRK